MAVILITNDVKPYFQDVANCLALPGGMTYRFRYMRQPIDWVGSLSSGTLEGKPGLIVFRNQLTGELVPVRHAHIVKALRTSLLFVIEFEVGDFVEGDLHELGKKVRDAVTSRAQADTPGGDLIPLLYEEDLELDAREVRTKSDCTQVERQVNGWLATIKAIEAFRNVSGVHFLYAVGLEAQTQKNARQVPVVDREFVVDADEAYDLRVLQYKAAARTQHAEEAVEPPLPVTLVCDKDVVIPIVDRALIVGQYDQLRFSLRTSPTRLGAGTVLQISRATQDMKDMLGESTDFVASISLPVRIRVWGFQTGLTLFGLAIFVLGPLVATKVTSPVFRLLLGSPTQAVGVLFALMARDPWSKRTYRAIANWWRDKIREMEP